MFVAKPEENVKYTASWEDFTWPSWVLPEIAKQIKEFYSSKMGRSPLIWHTSAIQNHAPKFGIRIRIEDFQNKIVCGRFVFAWNNIGRLVDDNAKVQYVCIDDPWQVSDGGMWRRPKIDDYEQSQ